MAPPPLLFPMFSLSSLQPLAQQGMLEDFIR